MPFTTLLLWAFGMGAAAALSGVHELRVSPRPFLLSDSFAAFVVFMLFLLLPASLYFYVFHGDWFMLYLIDVRRVSSPLVPLGLFAEFMFGACGFAYAAVCVRAQHSSWVAFALLACLAGALSVLLVCPDRLQHVGTFRQFQGGFGLARYGGALMQGGLAMGGLLAAGSVFLVYRIRRGQARILKP